jgi:hypothetical protein
MFHPEFNPQCKEHLIVGIVIVGGLIDSVIGIVSGAAVAITSAASALLPL